MVRQVTRVPVDPEISTEPVTTTELRDTFREMLRVIRPRLTVSLVGGVPVGDPFRAILLAGFEHLRLLDPALHHGIFYGFPVSGERNPADIIDGYLQRAAAYPRPTSSPDSSSVPPLVTDSGDSLSVASPPLDLPRLEEAEESGEEVD